MRITAVHPDSPLFGYVRPGYQLKQINGQPVRDSLDFQFLTADQRIELLFEDADGRETGYAFDSFCPAELGIALEDDRVNVCNCDCIFCFVRQQPSGMRPTLYLKDEDYRMSFTHGSFVTLSNVGDEDLQRIVEQRLSPLYVSVHATDDTLRRCMLRNEKLAPILPRLRYLAENGIEIHTQVVLCPEVNDGHHLDRTIEELAELEPSVASLAVVPVGLTKYRQSLPQLRSFTAEESAGVVRQIDEHQGRLLKKTGTRLVWAADEFYLKAGLELPKFSEYEEFAQFENGVGMARHTLTAFNRSRKALKNVTSDRRVLMLTGTSSAGWIRKAVIPFVTRECGLRVSVQEVTNRFWGESVTVSGLLTGQDLLRAAQRWYEEYDILLLPPNCVNPDGYFLDNMSAEHFGRLVDKPVYVGEYDIAATIREACLT